MKPLRHSAEAIEDLRSAMRYYEEQQAGLGTKLQDAVSAAEAQIQANPKLFALFEDTPCRLAQVSRFPYGVVYFEFDDHIRIVGILDLRRKPGYWQRRLRNLGN